MDELDLTSMVATIVRGAVKRPELELDPHTVAADVPGWDSFAMIEILMEIEARFGVSFKARDLDGVRNFGGLVLLVADKLRVRQE